MPQEQLLHLMLLFQVKLVTIIFLFLANQASTQPRAELMLGFGNHFYEGSAIGPNDNQGKRLVTSQYTMISENSWTKFLTTTPGRSRHLTEFIIEPLILPNFQIKLDIHELAQFKNYSLGIRTGIIMGEVAKISSVFLYNTLTDTSWAYPGKNEIQPSYYEYHLWTQYNSIPLLISIERKHRDQPKKPLRLLIGYKYNFRKLPSDDIRGSTIMPVSASLQSNDTVVIRITKNSGNFGQQLYFGVEKEVAQFKINRRPFPFKCEFGYSWGFGDKVLTQLNYDIFSKNTVTRNYIRAYGTGFHLNIQVPILSKSLKRKTYDIDQNPAG